MILKLFREESLLELRIGSINQTSEDCNLPIYGIMLTVNLWVSHFYAKSLLSTTPPVVLPRPPVWEPLSKTPTPPPHKHVVDTLQLALCVFIYICPAVWFCEFEMCVMQ